MYQKFEKAYHQEDITLLSKRKNMGSITLSFRRYLSIGEWAKMSRVVTTRAYPLSDRPDLIKWNFILTFPL